MPFPGAAVGFISDDFQQLLDAPAPDGGDDTELGKIRADRVDDRCLLANEEMARTMKKQAALLIDRLGRHEPYVWPRVTNRPSVRDVVLLPVN